MIKPLLGIVFFYSLAWGMQETAEVGMALWQGRTPEWLAPSPFNCPNSRDYDWSWPRCHRKEKP